LGVQLFERVVQPNVNSGRDCAAAVSATLAFEASAVMKLAASRMIPVSHM
jgi:hypothetical protein